MNKYLLTMVCACAFAVSGCATKTAPEMPAPMNVYFEHASAKMNVTDTTALKNYVTENEKFVKCPKSVVFVGGHTNSIGTVKYNDKLSQRRADATRTALINAGVPSDKIRVKAYGSRAPIADNNTENGLKVNRRAEIGFMPVIAAGDTAATATTTSAAAATAAPTAEKTVTEKATAEKTAVKTTAFSNGSSVKNTDGTKTYTRKRQCRRCGK